MTSNLDAFLKAVSTDADWLEELRGQSSKEGAVAFALAKASELGIDLTAEDFEPGPDELAESELAAVAGAGPCSCMLGGGGTESAPLTCSSAGYQDYVCACVAYGQGDGLERIWSWDEPTEYTRCMCVLAGDGSGC